MSRVGVLPRVNPFSSRFVEPGAIPFRFPSPGGLADVVRRLDEAGGWGQVVGPHGSGKSTLLAALLPALTAWEVRRVRLSAAGRELPAWVGDGPPPRAPLGVDGCEQRRPPDR